MVAPTIGADKIDSVEMQTFSSSKSATEGDSTSAVPTRTASKDMAPEHSLPEEPPNAAQRKQSNVQFAALLVPLFLAGWNDGTLGPLLPRIREHYNVGFTIVSLIFVFACIGFVGGAFLNVYVNEKFGFGKILVFGATLQVIAYALQAPAPPFPVYVLSYVINGVGLAVQDAQANGYVASLRDHAESKMGILHAAYGAGALCSPLVATQFAQMPRWSFHFLCSLGLAIINVIMTIVVFKFRTQDECHIAIGQAPGEKGTSSHSTFRQILGQRSVHILAFFILVYVGTEVTIGGWIVTYVIENRGGGPNSGYISAGFFGGLMVGRVALLWLNKKVGEWRVIFLYAALAIGLEMIVWFVPSLIGGGVAVSIVGVLLGPMYPIAMNQASRILPRWILTGSIGWIAGFGQAGSAVFPFATGALAQHYGIGSLHPLLVAMLAATVLLWAIVPRTPRKVE